MPVTCSIRSQIGELLIGDQKNEPSGWFWEIQLLAFSSATRRLNHFVLSLLIIRGHYSVSERNAMNGNTQTSTSATTIDNSSNDLWSSILDSVNRNRAVTTKHVVILGQFCSAFPHISCGEGAVCPTLFIDLWQKSWSRQSQQREIHHRLEPCFSHSWIHECGGNQRSAWFRIKL